MVAYPELLHEGKEFREGASRMQASLQFGNTKDLERLALKIHENERSYMLVSEPVSGVELGEPVPHAVKEAVARIHVEQ